jgi:hypothetical protein
MRQCILFRRSLLTFLVFSFQVFSCPCLAQNVPVTTAQALDGTTIVFPRPGSRKPLLVVIGFSHKSSGVFKQWNQQMLSRYWSDSQVDYYELADLQGVPSLIMGMILHGMRREFHGAEQSHFVPFTTGEEEWKRAVRYSAPETTYIVLADATGHIVWQTRGAPDDEKMLGLKKALAEVSSRPRP